MPSEKTAPSEPSVTQRMVWLGGRRRTSSIAPRYSRPLRSTAAPIAIAASIKIQVVLAKPDVATPTGRVPDTTQAAIINSPSRYSGITSRKLSTISAPIVASTRVPSAESPGSGGRNQTAAVATIVRTVKIVRQEMPPS
jgi:hypothetical protein